MRCVRSNHEDFATLITEDRLIYCKEGFVKAAHFLEENRYGLVGYILKNTLSELLRIVTVVLSL